MQSRKKLKEITLKEKGLNKVIKPRLLIETVQLQAPDLVSKPIKVVQYANIRSQNFGLTSIHKSTEFQVLQLFVMYKNVQQQNQDGGPTQFCIFIFNLEKLFILKYCKCS